MSDASENSTVGSVAWTAGGIAVGVACCLSSLAAGFLGGVFFETAGRNDELYKEYRRGYEAGREYGRLEAANPSLLAKPAFHLPK